MMTATIICGFRRSQTSHPVGYQPQDIAFPWSISATFSNWYVLKNIFIFRQVVHSLQSLLIEPDFIFLKQQIKRLILGAFAFALLFGL